MPAHLSSLRPALLERTGQPVARHEPGISPALLEQARHRLGRFALFMSLLMLGLAMILPLLPGESVTPTHHRLVYGLFAVTIGLSLGMFGLTRSPRFDHRQTGLLGLAYQILFCLAISIGEPWLNALQGNPVASMTFVSLLIVLYPLLIPTPPRLTAPTAVLAAATVPLGLWLVQLGDVLELDAGEYVAASIMPATSVLLALFSSHVVYGMSRDVTRARRLGSYHLQTCLGSGGMGEVWLARHRMLARPAAVKLVRPESLGGVDDASRERVRTRFEREAQATAGLRSPHTVQLYDYGISDDGVLYYVMELLDGLDLEALVRRFGPLPAERVVPILTQICDSLAEAHEQGLIHRDVKPANVYLCRYGRSIDHVKVLDFGLVKRTEGEADAEITQDRRVDGTPAYMAPEQILGHEIDARADLYALGCLGYWLLTGELVFAGDTPLAVLTRHAHDTPVPPSQRGEMPIPTQLETLLLSCLEKDPADRPASADELATRLRACPLPRPWSRERARHWWESHLPASTLPSDDD